MAPKKDPNAPIISADEAIYLAGGATILAVAISKATPANAISVNAIMQWRHTRSGLVPSNQAWTVATILGVPLSSLRPELRNPAEAAYIGTDRDVASAA